MTSLIYYTLVFLLLVVLAVTEFLITFACFGIRRVMHINVEKKKVKYKNKRTGEAFIAEGKPIMNINKICFVET